MTTERTYTWEEFKTESSNLRRDAQHSPILFRGQADAALDLVTTLERSGHGETIAEYYRLMLRIKTEVEIATDTKWDNYPSVTELETMARNYDKFAQALANLPHYAYMAYLRHHGFPSRFWIGLDRLLLRHILHLGLMLHQDRTSQSTHTLIEHLLSNRHHPNTPKFNDLALTSRPTSGTFRSNQNIPFA